MGISNSRRRLRQKRPDRCTTTWEPAKQKGDEDYGTTRTTHAHTTHATAHATQRNARVVEAGGTLEAEAVRSRVVEDVQVTQERGVGDALRAIRLMSTEKSSFERLADVDGMMHHLMESNQLGFSGQVEMAR
jgi:hypothetical protein